MSISIPRQAVVLAAGEGRRLQPMTLQRPKPLMPFLNRPLLEHTLTALARSGVQRVWINAWHLAQQVVDFVEHVAVPPLEITVVREPELLGTGGGLANLWARMPRERLLLLLPDIVADFDLAALARHHIRAGAVATMALTQAADPVRYGAVNVSSSGGGPLTDIAGLVAPSKRALVHGDSERAFVNASAHVFEPEFLDRLPRTPSCFIRQGYVPAIESGLPCEGWVHPGGWHDTGTMQDLVAAQAAALSEQVTVDAELLAAGGLRHKSQSLVHPSADVSPGAHLVGGTTVAEGCVVEDQVQLRRCLVMPGTRVAEGTHGVDQILGDGLVQERVAS